ncbi:MAG TPA: class I tRNA ligase family protein, partial [Pyrinomonadaceae bacterium]|nr:class I tRNA ligase family protein [Pyrinomonadaceae bacterium]
DHYGVDATRLALASIGSTDTRWNENQVESYRNFANKIWNAARFSLLNSEGAAVGRGFEGDSAEWALHDRWIVSRLNQAARSVNRSLDAYDFYAAVQTLYHFFWDDFCDWYIELSKADVTAPDVSPERDAARSRLVTVLEQALRLLHPFMPYITEELWQRLPGAGPGLLHEAYSGAGPTVMLTSYPEGREELIDERAEWEMQAIIELVSRVRNIRSELNVKPSQAIEIMLVYTDERLNDLFFSDTNTGRIIRLTRASGFRRVNSLSQVPRASARAVLSDGVEIAVPLEGLIDFAQERDRLGRERDKLQKEAAKLEAQLANPQFAERAPAEKVKEVRDRLDDIAQRAAALQQMMEALK